MAASRRYGGEPGMITAVKQCAFCGESVEAPLTAVIWSAQWPDASDRPTQQLWFHAACLAARLHRSVPFDGEAFRD
jgi:hypothetical protein